MREFFNSLLGRLWTTGRDFGDAAHSWKWRHERVVEMRLQSHATPIGSQKYNAHPSNLPAMVQETIRSPGQPLDAQTRAFMQSRFGNDCGHRWPLQVSDPENGTS